MITDIIVCMHGYLGRRVNNNGITGCLESVEWNGGMDYWNGTLEWTRTKSFHLHIIYIAV